MTFQAGDVALAEDLNAIGIIARGRRTTSSTSTTTEIGVLRLDDIPVFAGKLYRIYTSALHPDTSVANDIMNVKIRYTTDGSTPTTGSTILPASVAQVRQPDANNAEAIIISTSYAPAADETLSLLLTVARVAGTGNVVLFADGNYGIDLYVEAVGDDPGDTGVDI